MCTINDMTFRAPPCKYSGRWISNEILYIISLEFQANLGTEWLINTSMLASVHSFWSNSPQWARANSFMTFLDKTRHTTVGRTTLDKWSARRRDLYVTTLTTDRHSCPPSGTGTHNVNRRAVTDICLRSRGHWDWLCTLYGQQILHMVSTLVHHTFVKGFRYNINLKFLILWKRMEMKPRCYGRAKWLKGRELQEQQRVPDTVNINIKSINVCSLHIKIKLSCSVSAINFILTSDPQRIYRLPNDGLSSLHDS